MAGVTTCRSIREALDFAMIRSDRCSIAVFMAVNATERGKVAGIDMTIRASRPDALMMGAGIDWEPCVIESCAAPAARIVAGGAGGGECRRGVVRICGRSIVLLVAGIAIGRHR